MRSVAEIKAEHSRIIKKIDTWYDSYRGHILKWRAPKYYKNIWLSKLLSYYRYLVTWYTDRMNKMIANIESLEKKQKRAVIIGINYENSRQELRGCINDARNIREYLIESGNLTNAEQVCYMTDETSIKPTRKNILEKYAEILKEAKPGDKLFFTYSGHGNYKLDKNGDEVDNRDELLITIDKRSILDDELKRVTQDNLKEGVTVFILLDCCHSGTLMDLRYNYLSNEEYDDAIVNEFSEETKGNVYLISGCMDNQEGMDAYINNTFQGAMTWSFLRAVKENKEATWKQVLTRMRGLLAPYFKQVPQLSSGKKLDINSRIPL